MLELPLDRDWVIEPPLDTESVTERCVDPDGAVPVADDPSIEKEVVDVTDMSALTGPSDTDADTVGPSDDIDNVSVSTGIDTRRMRDEFVSATNKVGYI